LLPVTEEDINAMLDETAVGALLGGARGAGPADRAGLVRLAARFADCMIAHEEIIEMELNPVFVYEEDAVAVDARAVVEES
jgi:acetyl-CoA synthetase (ADP-forming)